MGCQELKECRDLMVCQDTLRREIEETTDTLDSLESPVSLEKRVIAVCLVKMVCLVTTSKDRPEMTGCMDVTVILEFLEKLESQVIQERKDSPELE